MKMIFVLAVITGRNLFERFQKAIKEESIGYEEDFNSSAHLDGSSWVTAWSGFKYTILNPDSLESAIVEYNGAYRGFLAQELIPVELKGKTLSAEITEGSALIKHGVEKFIHVDANDLASAYGLMQKAAPRKNYDVLQIALNAVEAARAVNEKFKKIAVDTSCSFAYAGSNSGERHCSNIENGDPSVYVICCPGGEQVKLEIAMSPWGPPSTPEHVIDRAVGWINKLQPVL